LADSGDIHTECNNSCNLQLLYSCRGLLYFTAFVTNIHKTKAFYKVSVNCNVALAPFINESESSEGFLKDYVCIYKVSIYNSFNLPPSLFQCFICSQFLTSTKSYSFPDSKEAGSDISSSSSSSGLVSTTLTLAGCAADVYRHSRMRCPDALHRKQSFFSWRLSLSAVSTHLALCFPARFLRLLTLFLQLPLVYVGAIIVSPSASTLDVGKELYKRVVAVVFDLDSLFFSLYFLLAALNWSVSSRLVMIRSTSLKNL
jgi:hypothetical protein